MGEPFRRADVLLVFPSSAVFFPSLFLVSCGKTRSPDEVSCSGGVGVLAPRTAPCCSLPRWLGGSCRFLLLKILAVISCSFLHVGGCWVLDRWADRQRDEYVNSRSSLSCWVLDSSRFLLLNYSLWLLAPSCMLGGVGWGIGGRTDRDEYMNSRSSLSYWVRNSSRFLLSEFSLWLMSPSFTLSAG